MKRCTGVRLQDGTELLADVVVANPDLPYVYEQLLEAPAEAQAEIDSEVKRLNKYGRPFVPISLLTRWRLIGYFPILYNPYLGSDILPNSRSISGSS